MSKAKKITVITGILCVFLGLIIACVAAALNGFDILKLSTVKYEVKTHNIEENFSNIEISSLDADVRFELLGDPDKDICKVDVTDSSNITTSVKIEDDTLKIKRTDDRKWYERIGILVNNDPKIVVYLSEKSYTELVISSVSGDLNIGGGFEFTNADIQSISGNIALDASVGAYANIKTTSGDITCMNAECGKVYMTSLSGDISYSYSVAQELYTETTSGDIDMIYVDVISHAELKSTSGDVDILYFDAATISIKTVSGDVEAKLDTIKRFVTETVSGDVSVPASDPSAGLCEIKTTSGDIEITVK